VLTRRLALLAGVATILLYIANAAALATYPWDWGPDEGLGLDLSRRILDAPATLYERSGVPLRDVYGPTTWAYFAPAIRLFRSPFAGARLFALGTALLSLGAVYTLVRAQARPGFALAAAALVLATMQESFQFMIVRPDGLTTALWLVGVALLAPRRLCVGAGRLGWWRCGAASLLLVAGILSKGVTVLLGFPLVLCWLFVDFASGVRLCVTLVSVGVATLALLQAATAGGFLWVVTLWRGHPYSVAHLRGQLTLFAEHQAGLLCWLAAGVVWAWRKGTSVWRDGTFPAWLGGLLLIPPLAKYGSSTVYLLPLGAVTAAFGGRLWSAADDEASALPALATALALLVGLATSRFPLPTREDRATADAFYATVKQAVAERGQPIFITRPEYAYFHVGQPVEVEATGYFFGTTSGLPGTEVVLRRVARAEYTLAGGATRYLGTDRRIFEALKEKYASFAGCYLGFYFGQEPVVLLAPKARPASFAPTRGARCEPLDSGAAFAAGR
jgi:hypothetical protein